MNTHTQGSSLLQLPKNIWWCVLSKFPVYDIFKENMTQSKLGNIIKDPKFRTWIMLMYKTNDYVYDIDIDQTFLQPQNTMSVRQCKFENDDDKGGCQHFVQVHWWGCGNNKLTFKGWNDTIDMNVYKDQYIPFQQKYDHLHQSIDEIESPPINQKLQKRFNSPIEQNNIKITDGVFRHNWDRHNLSGVVPAFDVSEQTKNIHNNIVLNDEGKPVNFPKPEKISSIDNTKFNLDYMKIKNDRMYLNNDYDNIQQFYDACKKDEWVYCGN